MTPTSSEQTRLDTIRAAMLRGDRAAAEAALAHAIVEFPRSRELRRVRAGLLQEAGHHNEAEAAFRTLLDEDPHDAVSALALARLLKDESRTAAAAAAVRTCFGVARNAGDAGLAIAAIELLDNCNCKADAAAVSEAAIAASPDDPRLHAYAGMLQLQLGVFDLARRHYLFALEHDQRAWEWHAPIGLSAAQRYREPAHPDFDLFRKGLERDGLSDLARAELHFSLGKAHDDIGGYAEAAGHLRQGNAIRHRLTPWSRKTWRRAVEARLRTKAAAATTTRTPGFTPVFIVGMPRTGTTLLAELLSRHPNVRNRGELPWLAQLAQRPALSGRPGRAALEDAAAEYARHARRDDAEDARWFIDKQPLNFRYVDLALAMFPDARIIHCVRDARDTALSLWMQCFLEEVHGYSYDFADIVQVMRDEQRLMTHWRELFPDSIRTVRYADLVAAPDDTVSALAHWLGLSTNDVPGAAFSPGAISTASLWQARQPVHSRSIERWRHYADHLPELARFVK